MDPNRKITEMFAKKFGNKVINMQNFHRKTGLYLPLLLLTIYQKRIFLDIIGSCNKAKSTIF